MKKPKLWNYKSGKRKGKLRQKSKDYLSFKLKEYWKTKKAIGIIEEQIKLPEIIYFINFRIAEAGYDSNSGTGVYGSLISPNYIPIEDAKILIKNALPLGYTPTGFYEAQDEGVQEKTELIMYRDDDDFFSEVINV